MKYKLPGWGGFHFKDRLPELADGEAYLILEGGLVGNTPSEPTTEKIQAMKWLLAKDDGEYGIVVGAIYEEYPKLRQSLVKDFDAHMLNMLYPKVSKVDDMRNLISLSRVYFYEESKDGLPYIGFDFECNWDVEHGIQVLINGDRVVAVGSNALDPNNIKNDN